MRHTKFLTSSIIALFVCILTAMPLTAADKSNKPKIEFASRSHNFGTIPEDGGPVTAVYEFTNTGNAPLIIMSVTNGGCGCTKPQFPTHPIKPGEASQIKVTFNPEGRPGSVNRTVRVSTNVDKKRIGLSFKGTVVK